MIDSVRVVRAAYAVAAIVGVCLVASSRSNDAEARSGAASAIARTSDSAIAPTGASTIAPTGESAIAPTSDSHFAPAHDSSIASTGSSRIAPSQTPVAPLKFDSGRAWEHLRRQVAFGPRPSGSAALADCRRYLLAELKTSGITAREQSFAADTPRGKVAMANIIATIPGRRADRLIIASHYDTKLYSQFRFVGASDSASSTAALLELGRVLKGRQNEFTIELLFLDGEEAVNPEWRDPDNTYGSRHYVRTAQQAGDLANVRALVLLDMIGDRNLTLRRDTNSTRWLTDVIWASARRLGYTSQFLAEDFAIGGDDHFPFLAAGIPSVDIIDLDYPAWHTAQDDLDHVSARSLQVVGDVVLDALPEIEKRVASVPPRR